MSVLKLTRTKILEKTIGSLNIYYGKKKFEEKKHKAWQIFSLVVRWKVSWRVVGGPFISDVSNIASVMVSVVLHMLHTTIG